MINFSLTNQRYSEGDKIMGRILFAGCPAFLFGCVIGCFVQLSWALVIAIPIGLAWGFFSDKAYDRLFLSKSKV